MTGQCCGNGITVSGDRWRSNTREEARFWRRWLSEPEFEAVRTQRLEMLAGSYPNDFHEAVGVPLGETIHVLDVGSGPISTLTGVR